MVKGQHEPDPVSEANDLNRLLDTRQHGYGVTDFFVVI